MSTVLVIGDYRKSSWSLRAWLVLSSAGVAFETRQVALEQADTRANILEYSPSGKLPCLLQDGLVVNDSLAIGEYIADSHPGAGLWPADVRLRGMARAAAAEMHAGFVGLRTLMPFGLGAGDVAPALTEEARTDIQRIFQIWRQLKRASGSAAFLCGAFGIVDAMFAPVVFRFRRYGIEVPADLQDYCAQIQAHPPMQAWLRLATQEG